MGARGQWQYNGEVKVGAIVDLSFADRNDLCHPQAKSTPNFGTSFSFHERRKTLIWDFWALAQPLDTCDI